MWHCLLGPQNSRTRLQIRAPDQRLPLERSIPYDTGGGRAAEAVLSVLQTRERPKYGGDLAAKRFDRDIGCYQAFEESRGLQGSPPGQRERLLSSFQALGGLHLVVPNIEFDW